jgi:hypothetical protein
VLTANSACAMHAEGGPPIRITFSRPDLQALSIEAKAGGTFTAVGYLAPFPLSAPSHGSLAVSTIPDPDAAACGPP